MNVDKETRDAALEALQLLESGDLTPLNLADDPVHACDRLGEILRRWSVQNGERDVHPHVWVSFLDGDLVMSPVALGRLMRFAFEAGAHFDRSRRS